MDFLTIVNDLVALVQSKEAAEWIVAITAVVTAATAITALTPSKSDNKIIDFVLKILNFVAGNVLKNKNADAE